MSESEPLARDQLRAIIDETAREAMSSRRYPRIVTTISISAAAWNWLREQAQEQALREGGRPSASAVIERLVRMAWGQSLERTRTQDQRLTGI